MRALRSTLVRSAILAAAVAVPAAAAHAAVGVYVNVGPVLRADYRPPCPGYGYVWAPGYWNGGYYTEGYWYYPGGDYRAQEAYQRHQYHEYMEHQRVWDRDDYRRGDRDEWRGDRGERHEYRGHDRDDDGGRR